MQPQSPQREHPIPEGQHNLASPHEEIAFLRDRLAQLEANFAPPEGHEVSPIEQRQQLAHNLVEAYHAAPGVQVLEPGYEMQAQEAQSHAHEVTLNLEPEEHDQQIEQLYALMMKKGVKNALAAVESTHSPHLVDDFHRFLVQYLVAAHEIPGAKNTSETYKQLAVSLFEVTLPRPEEGDQRSFKEFIAMMEQLYAGMQSVATGSDMSAQTYTIEIAKPAGTDEVIVYAGVPNEKAALFEKQVIGLFSDAHVTLAPNDYNIFSDEGAAVGARAIGVREDILSLRTFDQFETDPIDVILNVFSKLETHEEGAALQLVVSPAQTDYVKKWGKALDKIRTGTKLKDALEGASFASIASDLFSSSKKDNEDPADQVIDQTMVESIQRKLSSSIVEANLRLIAAAGTEARAEDIIADMGSAFNQFNDPVGGGIEFELIKKKKRELFFKHYTFRSFSDKGMLRLNLREMATMIHFPARSDSAPQLKQSKAATGPAPLNMPREGLLLGYNNHRGTETEVRMDPKDRMRHFYVIGQTGTGKSGTLLSMIQQDIMNGEGVCYIDPHGSDVQTILSWIPEHRAQDVIYFDPAYMPRPMGLNMLEYDTSRPEQITLIIDELMGIFNQLFDMKAQGGAMFQQYFKNSAMLVMGHPESGNTLLEITRVLGDSEFRQMKLKHCTNPIVRQFWENAEKTTGDQSLANFVPYISSKFDPLVSNEILRPVIAQEESSFNVREIMDNKKILLVNLSKGRLGELNANLLGLILVGKIQMAALGRADSHGEDLPPFYLYIDEFQNVTTPSIASILSEARKYKLSLNMAHQYLSQLDDDIRNAVMGNVGSMQIFRISPEDADVLEPRLAPTFSSDDIIKLDNRNAYMSILIDGQPATPFSMRTADWPPQNKAIVESIKELSYLTYGRPRDEVEAEIMGKYQG